jgi:hypothetical protein
MAVVASPRSVMVAAMPESSSSESLPESGPEVRPASARVTPLPADLAVLAAECEAVARGGSPRARRDLPSMGAG